MAGDVICAGECRDIGEFGRVENRERVGRLVTSPNHFRKDGSLKPGAFPISHIRASGVSLLRVDKMSEARVTEVCEAIASLKEGETPSGVLLRLVADVRSIKDDHGDQALCVLDDPVRNMPPAPDNEAHAIALSSKDRADEDILEIQSELLSLFDGTERKLGRIHA